MQAADQGPADRMEAEPAVPELPDDAVEVMFEQLNRLVASLGLTGEPTLAVSVSVVASKSLLLAAASRFEAQLTEMLEEITKHRCSPEFGSFCLNQGVVRKYHTLFDWKATNANKFFALFGSEFLQRAKELAGSDPDFAAAIREFMALGSMRNNLVHEDFAAFPLTDTLDELIQKYRVARSFLPAVGALLMGTV